MTTASPEETQALAAQIADRAAVFPFKGASVIALEGELGAGKTTLVQSIAKHLGVKEFIKSPTFVLMKQYKFKNQQLPVCNLYHLDCYRLRDEKDLETLGLKKIFDDKENLVLIEWSDRVQKILPLPHMTIHIDHIGENKRRIAIN